MAYTVLQQTGVWCNDPHSVAPEQCGNQMRAHKVKWMSSLVQEGLGEVNTSEYTDANWWNRLTSGGKVVKIGWVNDTHGAGENVEAFCSLASALVTRYGLQAVMFDLEKAWEADPTLPKVEQDARWQRWDRFLKEWRRLRPGILTILSTYGNPARVAFPWANIAGYGVRYCPQNLYRYARDYEPRYSISGAKLIKYPTSYVHFMLSREEGHVLDVGMDMVREAKALGSFSGGISSYLVENHTAADWALLKQAWTEGLSFYNP